MLAKKFGFGFGIAIILPMMIHYGVSTFTPRPDWKDYYNYSSCRQCEDASPEKKND